MLGLSIAATVLAEHAQAQDEPEATGTPGRSAGAAVPLTTSAALEALPEAEGYTLLITDPGLSPQQQEDLGAILIDVIGEAGMGKSRLVHEASQRFGMPATEVVADQYSLEIAFGTFGSLLRDALVLGPDAGPSDLRLAVAAIDTTLLPWLPLVGATLGIEVEQTAEVSDLDQNFARTRMLDVLCEVLVAARPGAAWWVIEDAQWVDAASGDAFRRLLDRHLPPWGFVFVRRPGDSFRSGATSDVAIEVAGLPAAAAAHVVPTTAAQQSRFKDEAHQ